MKQSRFSEEQIIGMLREQEAGAKTADVCRKHGISAATFYQWEAKYGGRNLSEVRHLKMLVEENANGVRSRGYRPGPYTPLEGQTSTFVRTYLDEMRTLLAEPTPLRALTRAS